MDGVSSAGRTARMHLDAEHLELLGFRKSEQQDEERRERRRPPLTIADRMLYNCPFIIAESYEDITEEEIEFLENELKKYKESIKDKLDSIFSVQDAKNRVSIYAGTVFTYIFSQQTHKALKYSA